MQLDLEFIALSSVAPAHGHRSPRSIRSSSQRALRLQGGNEADAGRNLHRTERNRLQHRHGPQPPDRQIRDGNGPPGISAKKTDKLIFHRYGSQYFLTAILGGKGSQGMVIPTTSQEKELQVAHAAADSANNVEIASK